MVNLIHVKIITLTFKVMRGYGTALKLEGDKMKRVLIVDDERLILDGLSKSLSNEYTEIKTIETGEDALKEIVSCFYDLCILDIYLPDINGLNVMKKIREISPETKVVIMTAYHITNEMTQEIEDNAHYFISKPFDLSQIKVISEMALSGEGKDARRSKRIPFMKTIVYFASVLEDEMLKILNLKGDIVDVNDDGIGMKTDYPLKTGYMVRFPEETKHDLGVVKWSMSTGGGSYRVGIEFLKRSV
ncbi:MAG: response regulator [Nitrospirae bacterium]|nr:response regulator [Nitrospirota bacterium]